MIEMKLSDISSENLYIEKKTLKVSYFFADISISIRVRVQTFVKMTKISNSKTSVKANST